MTVQAEMTDALKDAFHPSMLTIENESHRHNVPPNSETHFKVTLVSELFEGQRSVRRHQSVYAVLGDWLAGPVHALALHTYTPKSGMQLVFHLHRLIAAVARASNER